MAEIQLDALRARRLPLEDVQAASTVAVTEVSATVREATMRVRR